VPDSAIVGFGGPLDGVSVRVSAVPLPQASIPCTIIVPTPEPTVAVIVPVVPPVVDQPVPETVQLKLVAPVDAALTVTGVAVPAHGAVGVIVTTGLVGNGEGDTVKVKAVLDVQELLATTETVATVEPVIKLIESTVLVPLQPVPVTVHV
jgi:hypothetical protein